MQVNLYTQKVPQRPLFPAFLSKLTLPAACRLLEKVVDCCSDQSNHNFHSMSLAASFSV